MPDTVHMKNDNNMTEFNMSFAAPTIKRSPRLSANATVTIESKFERETDKAILANVTIDTACGQKSANLWFPKSQVTVDEQGNITAPAWLLDVKHNDVAQKFYNGGFYGFLVLDTQNN